MTSLNHNLFKVNEYFSLFAYHHPFLLFIVVVQFGALEGISGLICFVCATTGAKYYYLRAILHNYDDDKAVEILSNIVPALGADSQILIDEVVMPETGAHAWPAGLDMQMYTLFGAIERTGAQWDAILERAGLQPVAVKKYAPVVGSSVIFAARK